MSISFIVLHYLLYEVTVRCIDSVLEKTKVINCQIVVVDNGSNNGSGNMLMDKYKDNKNVHFLINEKNLGFAAGNNIGYKYAKEVLNAEYIITINNDVEMIQDNFVEVMLSEFEKYHYHVLGPDIINLDGVHQSPQRNHIVNKWEVSIWLMKRVFYTYYLKLIRKTYDKKHLLVDLYKKKEKKRINAFQYDYVQEMVEIQGACIIFSPLFVAQSDIAFEELGFLYVEESTLAYRCKRNNWKIVYSPYLKIKHLEKMSTKEINQNYIDREIFYSEYNVKSLKALLKKIRYDN